MKIGSLFILLTFLACTISNKISGQIVSNNINSLASLYYKKGIEHFTEAEYDSSIYYCSKAGELFNNYKIKDSNALCLIKISDSYRKMHDYDNAKNYLKRTENFINTFTNNKETILIELNCSKAALLLDKQEHQNSIFLLTQTIKLERQFKPSERLAIIYILFGKNYFLLDDYKRAHEYFKKALELTQTLNNMSRVAQNYNNIATVHNANGNYSEALKLNEKALKIYIDNQEDANISRTYKQIGLTLYFQDNYSKALKYFNKSLEKDLKSKNEFLLADDYYHIGILFHAQRQFDKALSYYNKSLKIRKKIKDTKGIADIYIMIALVYESLEQYKIVLDYYEKALTIYKNLDLNVSCIKLYNNFGVIHYALGQYTKSIEYFKLALEINQKLGLKFNSADNINNIGAIYLAQNEYQTAIDYLKDALKIYKELNRNVAISKTYNNIGEVYSSWNKYGKALESFQFSINALVKDFENTDVYKNPKLDNVLSEIGLLMSLNKKSYTLRLLSNTKSIKKEKIKDLNMSLETYDISIELIDKIRKDYTQKSKLFSAKSEQITFNNATKVAYELYRITGNENYKQKAFQYTEKSKYSILLSSIRDFSAKQFGGIPNQLQKEEKNLKFNLSLYDKKLNDEKQNHKPDQDKISSLEDTLFVLGRKYDKLIKQLEENYPEYYRLKYNTSVADNKTIMKILNNKEAIIEYSLSDTILMIFVITSNRLELIAEPIDSQFFKDINIVRKNLSNLNIVNNPLNCFQDYTNSAYNLYKKLVKPIIPYIKDKTLTIIPDGILGIIPFESLLTEKINEKRINYKNLPYLIRLYSISYEYSATLLLHSINKESKRVAKYDLLAIAPSFKEKDKFDSDLIVELQASEREFMDLIGTKTEVKSIHKIFKGEIYLDSQATESNFKSFAPEYKILHIATHGVIDDENPMYSKLIFYRKNDTIEDGFLNTYELFNMQLNAELAVLSACNTGFGKLQKGEGIMSLARGFLYAGVPSIVVSLWQVNDESSAQIMELFYLYLKDGIPKDEALRKAKLDYLKQADNITANPYFWAGFVHIGNKRPLSLGKSRNYWWLLIFIIPIAGVILYFKRKASRG